MNDASGTGNQREEEILRVLQNSGGSCRVSFIAQELGVASETIRRNIRTLEQRDLVRKVHGGVHLVHWVPEISFSQRMDTQAEIKKRLAETVAGMIADGDSIFLDIGSTTAYVALALRNHSGLFVVTNSIFVAQTLSMRNNNRVFLAGGELRPHDGGAFGAEAFDLVRRFNTQFAVFSISAINASSGFMLHDLDEANIAAIAASNATSRIVVGVSEKFGKHAPIILDHTKHIDTLVTDAAPPAAIRDFLERENIALVLARPEGTTR